MKRIYTSSAAVVCLFAAATAGAHELAVVADTFVRTTTPTTNYGSQPVLEVSPTSTTYLRFAVPPATVLGAAGGTAYAELRVYVNRVVTPGTILARQMFNSTYWSEDTLTTTLSLLPFVLGTQTVTTSGTYLSFDI